MDKDISRANADNKKELLACLNEDLANALKRHSLEFSASIRLTLRRIHQGVSLLLSKNMELSAKKMNFVRAIAEKESLNININSAKSKLNELSSKVMIEDSLLISLEFETKELQAKINDCKTRLAAKKCKTSIEIERTKALVARYSEVMADDPDAVMETSSSTLNGQNLETKCALY
ncbi:Uncharacterized protein Adt_05733 [Abeliophyllum distichum]|uniref:Uncharacterized protein n=1 Tax=Abeliophyllum distichum TaxID=126358 RepID=A0ABD1V4X8_9LAMI